MTVRRQGVRVRGLPLALTVPLLLSGCALVPEPGPADVAGPTDGYQPTPGYLKVFVKGEDGTSTLVDFDRKDWYVAKIADKLDLREVPYLAIHGQERDILGEVVVETALQPEDLGALRYDRMKATAQERQAMDLEYEDLLARVPPPTSVTLPTLPAP